MTKLLSAISSNHNCVSSNVIFKDAIHVYVPILSRHNITATLIMVNWAWTMVSGSSNALMKPLRMYPSGHSSGNRENQKDFKGSFTNLACLTLFSHRSICSRFCFGFIDSFFGADGLLPACRQTVLIRLNTARTGNASG